MVGSGHLAYMADPKVSVIIPSYNRGYLITKTLESVRHQTYKNIEIIVIDDGSTDNSKEVISAYISRNGNNSDIKYIQQRNSGAPAARNNGLNSAKGDYIVFFDSDDLMLPDRIEKQSRRMVAENSDCCACGFYYNNVGGRSYIPPVLNRPAIALNIDTKLFGSTQSWMFKKEIVQSVGAYDVDLLCKQDWDLTFRVLAKGPKVSVVQEALSIFVSHEGEERIMLSTKNTKGLPSIFKYHFKVITYGIKRKEMPSARKGVRNLAGDVSSIFKNDRKLSWFSIYSQLFVSWAGLQVKHKIFIFIYFSFYFTIYQFR
ncbi:glycosyltransferase family 2 protein [Parapedobacter tibetensis]|uniref:glycosyltransferase family 2 protein n=1 Tax=Parapedobacter tibetensis TaxID=2972951 RepID=UPI00214D93AC|nr:glycosyltransferase family A protein [Parapedobacter tibetensis]